MWHLPKLQPVVPRVPENPLPKKVGKTAFRAASQMTWDIIYDSWNLFRQDILFLSWDYLFRDSSPKINFFASGFNSEVTHSWISSMGTST